MANIGDTERNTQDELISFFDKELKYTFLGSLAGHENGNILHEYLFAYLINSYPENITRAAITELEKVSADMTKGLYDANKQVYDLLKYGVKIPLDDGNIATVSLINWTTPTDNDFAIAEEVTIKARISEKRPDIVIYVNGIALSVIELKKSSVSVSNGIRQNLTNQKEHFIRPFFTTVQTVIAANRSEGVRFGVIETSEEYFLEWKNDVDSENELDKYITNKIKNMPSKFDWQMFSLFEKNRFLQIIHDFVIFDGGRKKIARYNQYFGIKAAQLRITKREGGIIWHTQGSGKSLTMVWLAKWILENNPKARVLVVTDREELDSQISDTFADVSETIERARSCSDLISILNKNEHRLICSLIHKFGHKGGEVTEDDYEKYIEELKKSLPPGFSAKGEVFVFVDECHRTQSGKLHQAMRKGIIPNGVFIGFTGTPLLRKDKDITDKGSTLSVFGGYIHVYKYDQAVRDGVVLDLRYEARDIPQEVSDKRRIDEWFEAKTLGLTPRASAKLKQQWGNIQTIFSSLSRLEKVVVDIMHDFQTKDRLAEGRGNAILVAEDIYAACRYYEIFQSKGFKKCAIITSYEPNPATLRTATTSLDEDTPEWTKFETYKKMLGKESRAEFEKEAKRKFVKEPANMKLLIVANKLLTGFDAPSCTYLYIDRSMRDHGLFQAICRVNRLDGADKDFGFIIDYKELFGNLTDAVGSYSAENPFAEYDKDDIDGILKRNASESQKYFEGILDDLNSLCDGVKSPRKDLEYIQYFCGENGVDVGSIEVFSRVRENLYRLVGKLVRSFAEFKCKMSDVGYSASDQHRAENNVKFYIELREIIGNASGDFIDFKRYEPGMRFLIDNYLSAESSQKIGCFDDFTLLDFIQLHKEKLSKNDANSRESAAEAIENNIRKKIIEKKIVNPLYYEKMSEVLERLIEERKNGTIEYKDLVSKYIALASNVSSPEQNQVYPSSIKFSQAKRMFFDNFGASEYIANKLYDAVITYKQDGFRSNLIKGKRIKRALEAILGSKEQADEAFDLVCAQEEF